MVVPILEVTPRFAIGQENKLPWIAAERLILPGPGIYTLEGPNGSGKSKLVELLTGTLPNAVDAKNPPQVRVAGNEVRIRRYRDALAAGIVAVFQGDDMISSMRAWQYLELVHSTAKPIHLGQYGWAVAYHIVLHSTLAWAHVVGPALPRRLQWLLKGLEPPELDWGDRAALREAAETLLRKHELSPDLLEKVPTRMSGGELAAIRLVSAQLHKDVRVLLLDEALNGVERNIWPRFVDNIKTWADAEKVAVLAISHNSDELLRWAPRQKFVIRDGELVEDLSFTGVVARRVPRHADANVPVMEISSASEASRFAAVAELGRAFQGFAEITVLYAEDDADRVKESLDSLLPAARRKSVPLTRSEEGTGFRIEALHRLVSTEVRSPRTVVIAAGDGEFLSEISIVASSRRQLRTSFMAFAPLNFPDAVNLILTDDREVRWARGELEAIELAVEYSPNSFILLTDILAGATQDELKNGLAECLRYGLLFSAGLFDEAASLLSAPQVRFDEAMAVLRRAAHIVNEVMEVDRTGAGFRRLSTLGKAGAAAFRRNGLTYGRALLLGITLELLATDQAGPLCSLIASLLKICEAWPATFPAGLGNDAILQELAVGGSSAGPGDNQGPAIRLLSVAEVGLFDVTRFRATLAVAKPSSADLAREAERFSQDAFVVVQPYRVRAAIEQLRQLLGSRERQP